MKFLKWRDTWSYGDGAWQIILISLTDEIDKDILNEKIESLNDDKSWSDKFRGIDYEIIDYPGHEWMKKTIRNCKDSINRATDLLGEYNALFYKNGGS